MYSSELKLKGLKVRTFESPEKALFYLTMMSATSEMPSLIIMDYNMPKKNGYDVLLLLKQNEDTKDIPVVIYSTSISSPLKEQLLNAGALDCFTKTWTYKGFVTQVDKFQERTSSFTNN